MLEIFFWRNILLILIRRSNCHPYCKASFFSILLLYMWAKRGCGGRKHIKEKANCERKLRQRRSILTWLGEMKRWVFAGQTDAYVHPRLGPSHLRGKLWWSMGIDCLSGSCPNDGSDEIMAKKNEALFSRRPTYTDGPIICLQAELCRFFTLMIASSVPWFNSFTGGLWEDFEWI